MAKIQGPAYTGQLTSDLTDVKDILVDIPPGGLKGARGEQDGIAEVLTELSHVMPQYGDDAEIHPALYTRIVDATANIEKLRAKELLLEKQLEVVRETRTQWVNNREDDISAIAAKAEHSALQQKKSELFAHFEKTIQYRSQSAEKGVATRKKNQQSSGEPESN
jgi:hypothetical protein